MTPRQQQFCREYVIDLNSTQAAIRAGYAKKTANREGSRLLLNVDIKGEIEKLMAKREKRTDITADRVLQSLATIAFVDVRKLFDENGDFDVTSIPDELAGAIAGIEPGQYGTKVKINDRLKALELIGRHLAMFTDKVQNDVSMGQVVLYLPENGRETQTDG